MADSHQEDGFGVQATAASPTREETAPTSTHRVIGSAPSPTSAEAPASSLTSSQLRLFLQRPSSIQEVADARTKEDTVVVDRDTTVAQIKTRIASTWHGRPKEEGLRLIARGRVLGDSERMATALNAQIGDSFAHPVQVAVRPTAWTSAPATPKSAQSSAADPGDNAGHMPTPQVIVTATTPEVPSASGSGEQPSVSTQSSRESDWPPSDSLSLLMYYARLSRPQRAGFTQQVISADVQIAMRIESVKERFAKARLTDLGLRADVPTEDPESGPAGDEAWLQVEERVIALLRAVGLWSEDGESANPAPRLPDGYRGRAYERVTIQGLPFLLHIPQALRSPTDAGSSADGSDSTKTHTSTLAHLQRLASAVSKLRLAVTRMGHAFLDAPAGQFWATAASRPLLQGHPAHLAVGQFDGLLPVPAGGLGLLGFGGADEPPLQGVPVNAGLDPRELGATRMHRFEVVISLDTLLSYIGPLLWLSMKLTFLLYLFARNATAQKRAILIGLSALWVVWEGWAIRSRRRSERRRREREAREQEGGQPGRRAAQDPIRALLDGARNRQRGPAPDVAPEVDPAGAEDHQDAVPVAPAGETEPAAPPAALRSRGPASATRGRSPAYRPDTAALRTAIHRLRSGAIGSAADHRRARRANRLSLKYWIGAVANMGLTQEYGDLERRSGARVPAISPWQRRIQNVITGVTLFVATLLPEAERKRRKALEKRRKLLQAIAQHLEHPDERPDEQINTLSTSADARLPTSPADAEEGTTGQAGSSDGASGSTAARVDAGVLAETTDVDDTALDTHLVDARLGTGATSPTSDTDEEGGPEEAGGAMMLF